MIRRRSRASGTFAALLRTTAITTFLWAGHTYTAAAQSADNAAPPSTPAKTPYITQFNAVSVTASRDSQQAIDTPASVSVITHQELLRRQPENMADLFRGMPGVEVVNSPRNTVALPTIRGLNGERIVRRVDGARNNFLVGHKGGVFIDPAFIKQVEVLRGAASTMQGTGAIGGVIDMKTVDAYDFLRDGESYGASLSHSYQSADDGHKTTAFGYAAPSENTDVLLGISRRKADNFKDGQRHEQPYTEDDSYGLLLNGGVNVTENHRINVRGRIYRDDHALPATPDGTSLDSIAGRESMQDSFVINHEYNNPTNTLINSSITLYYDHSRLEEVRYSDGREDVREQSTYGLEASNVSRFELSNNIKLNLTLGGEIYEDENTGLRNGKPLPGFYPDANRIVAGTYGDMHFTLFNDLDITAGLRYDRYDQKADNLEKVSESKISPRASIAYRFIPALQGYASYTEGFRAPSLTEMFPSGLHFPGFPPFMPNNYFIPNADLKPEKSRNLEFGLNIDFSPSLFAGDSLQGKVAYFRNSFKDYIESQTDIAAGTTQANNVGSARISGYELELRYDVADFYTTLAASRIRGKDKDTGTDLSNIPADKVSLGAGYTFTAYNLDVGGRATLVKGQERTGSAAEELSGYTLVDAFAVWQPGFLNGVTLNAGIDNILDRTYKTSIGTINQPGRNFKLGATVQF